MPQRCCTNFWKDWSSPRPEATRDRLCAGRAEDVRTLAAAADPGAPVSPQLVSALLHAADYS